MRKFVLTAVLLSVSLMTLAQVKVGAGFSAAGVSGRVVQYDYVYEPGPFPSTHASTIVETDGHELLSAFFGGSYESNPDVCIWLCRKTDDGWSEAVKVADGVVKGVKTACWNPVLYQIPGGDLLLFYKVGTEVQRWDGYVIRSKDGGKTWSEPEKLPYNVLGPIKNKPIQIGNSLICGSSRENGGWRVNIEKCSTGLTGWEVSTDLNYWRGPIELIQPTFIHSASSHGEVPDTLMILCRNRKAGDPIMSSSSYDGGMNWTGFIPMPLNNNNSGIDAATVKIGSRTAHLLVYNDAPADSPSARTPICVAISFDMAHWTKLLTLEDTPGEYSYPAIIQASDGLVHITYTDHRQRIRHAALELR